MRSSSIAVAAAGALALAASLGAAAPGAARPQVPHAAAHPTAVTALTGEPTDVAVLSTTDAWAVQQTDVMFHWNGTAWAKVKLTNADSGFLRSISGDSPTDAWAVGSYDSGPNAVSPLIMHWNGTSWTKAATPDISVGANLTSVSADSPTDAWATGTAANSKGVNSPVFMHWNGSTWSQVTGPHPGTNQSLGGVTSINPTDAWTNEIYQSSGGFGFENLQWNGSEWAKVHVPDHCTGMGTTADPSDIWSFDGDNHGIACHWNGTKWATVPVPDPYGTLQSVGGADVISPSLAFAAGFYTKKEGSHTTYTMLIQWNGTKWSIVPTPNPGVAGGDGSTIGAVDASSATNAWAVGTYMLGSKTTGEVFKTLMLHWNGKTWSRG
jgi:hypothetical protein